MCSSVIDDAAFFSHLSWYSGTNKPISTVVRRHDFADFLITWHDCDSNNCLEDPLCLNASSKRVENSGKWENENSRSPVSSERGVEQRPAGE